MNDNFSPRNDSALAFRPPSLRATWGPIALVIVTGLVGLLPALAFFLPADNGEATVADAIFGLGWYSSIAAVVYLAARWTGGGWENLGVRRPTIKFPKLGLIPAGCYFASLLAVPVYSIVINILGLDFLKPDEQLSKDIFDDATLVAFLGFSVIVAAPVVEELFFRGFLFGGLRRFLPFLPAALLSGLVFSLAHADLGLIIPFTMIGALLAYAYEKTGTIFGSMVVHFVFNAVSFLIMLVLYA